MPSRLPAALLCVLGCFLVSQATLASANLRWLDYSPVRHFTDKDWDMARAAAKEALENSADGMAVEWKNPDSGAHGSMTPLTTRQLDGRTCRDLKIRNHAARLEGGGTYEFCQQPDGEWAVSQGQAR
jgi:surface antigen